MPTDVTDVIIADRDRCCNYGRHDGWGSGWGAVGGALVGGGFGAAAVSIWDKVNDTKADIQEVKSTVREAQAGVYKDISDATSRTNDRVDGVAREVLNNRFTTERGMCDLGYKINTDIRDAKDSSLAGDRSIMERLCQMERQQADCCCETKGLIREMKAELSLQAERNYCDLKQGQKDLACLIKDQAKDQEIARLNRDLKAKDEFILNQKIDFLIRREINPTTTGGTGSAAA